MNTEKEKLGLPYRVIDAPHPGIQDINEDSVVVFGEGSPRDMCGIRGSSDSHAVDRARFIVCACNSYHILFDAVQNAIKHSVAHTLNDRTAADGMEKILRNALAELPKGDPVAGAGGGFSRAGD